MMKRRRDGDFDHSTHSRSHKSSMLTMSFRQVLDYSLILESTVCRFVSDHTSVVFLFSLRLFGVCCAAVRRFSRYDFIRTSQTSTDRPSANHLPAERDDPTKPPDLIHHNFHHSPTPQYPVSTIALHCIAIVFAEASYYY